MSKNPTEKDMAALIELEKRSVARGYFEEVRECAEEDGIESSILAETLIENALMLIAREQGSEQASRLISKFKELDEMGLLPAERTLQ